jgi:uncharacterized protein YidB (DUF937 family)
MGLMDVLRGMENGPHGQRTPSPPGSSGGGMSPLTMALIALLGYKALKSLGGSSSSSPTPANPSHPTSPSGGVSKAGLPGGLGGAPVGPFGGLGDLFKGGLGGLLAGGTAGAVLSGGLGDILKKLQESGHGTAANSWVGTGANQAISPNDIGNALGPEMINTLTSVSGMSREQLLAALSQHLPEVVDHLTPGGRVPTSEEAARLL